MTDPDIGKENVSAGGGRHAGRHIIRAGILIMVAHGCMKLVSPVQYMLVGQLCDEVTRDLFVFGYEGLLLMLFFIGEEALGPAFLPVFMNEKEKENGEKKAWDFGNTILTIQFILITLVVGTVAIVPESVVKLLTAWEESDKAPVYMEMAPVYARYMVLGLFGLSLGSTTYMLLNAYKRFFLAALGDALFKGGIVVALALAWALNFQVDGKQAVVVFVVGAVLGSLLKLGSHLAGLGRKVKFFRPRCNWRNPALRKFGLLVAPLIAGILFAKLRDTYNNILVLSVLEEGVMSATAFGRKIYQTLSFLGPYAVSIAMLPFFCEMVTRKEKDRLGAMVTTGSRLTLLMCSPLAIVFVALSLPVTQVLFQGGHYGFDSAVQAATANACYTLVLPFAALECIFMQTYFADRRMLLVTVIGIIFSALTIGISYLFVVHLGWRGLWAVAAVSLGFTLSKIAKVVTLGGVLKRFVPCFPPKETAVFGAKVLVVTLLTGMVAYGTYLAYIQVVPVPEVAERLVVLRKVAPSLVISGVAAAAVCAGSAFLLCRDDVGLIVEWGRAKLRNWTPTSPDGE